MAAAVESYRSSESYISCAPLFENQEEYKAFALRHAAHRVPIREEGAADVNDKVHLGVKLLRRRKVGNGLHNSVIIVVQGGTFLNDAVLRAFEKEIGRDVIRRLEAGEVTTVKPSLVNRVCQKGSSS